MDLTTPSVGPRNMALARTADWPLIGTVVLALALRIWGLNFGLPYIYHSDEPRYISVAQHIFKTGNLDPHSFEFLSINSFVYIVNALAYIPYYLAGKLAGVFHSSADLPALVMQNQGAGYTPMASSILLGRLVTTCFGVGAVVLVFLIGRQLTGSRAVGLLAALMMAVSPANVTHSHYITPDMFLGFFVALTFWGAVLVFQQGRTWQYIVAGIGIGFTVSTKINGALIVVPLVVAHVLRRGAGSLKDYRLYLAGLAALLAFFAATPFALVDYQKYLADLRYEAEHYSTGHPGMEGNSLQFYMAYLWYIEGPIALLAAIEMLRAVIVRSRPLILLALFPTISFGFISSFAVRNDRTLLPLTPFLFLLAASLLVVLFKKLEGRVAHLPKIALATLAVAALLFTPLQQTIRSNTRLSTIDSRETARIWIAENLPQGARVAMESYAPYIDPQRFAVQPIGRMIDYPVEWYVANRFDYLVFGASMYGRFYQQPDLYAREVAQYNALFEHFSTVKIFNDGGYEVRIVRLN
jgi:4-amino-4-deoxy-L-arabinose transferase-like glycosyltransferase